MHGARLDAGHLIETRGDGREQNLVIDRLDEIVVGAGLLAGQNVVPLGQGRQEDERHVRHGPLLAQGLEHVVTAEARHGDVAEDEVGTVLLKQASASLPLAAWSTR